MKDRNPFLWAIIYNVVAIVLMIVGLVCSSYVDYWASFIVCLCLLVVDSVMLGWDICKYNAYRNLMVSKRHFEEMLEKIKQKENEPFKEYDNGRS